MYCKILARVKPIFYTIIQFFSFFLAVMIVIRLAQEIEAIPIDLKIARFDREFASAGEEGFTGIT